MSGNERTRSERSVGGRVAGPEKQKISPICLCLYMILDFRLTTPYGPQIYTKFGRRSRRVLVFSMEFIIIRSAASL